MLTSFAIDHNMIHIKLQVVSKYVKITQSYIKSKKKMECFNKPINKIKNYYAQSHKPALVVAHTNWLIYLVISPNKTQTMAESYFISYLVYLGSYYIVKYCSPKN